MALTDNDTAVAQETPQNAPESVEGTNTQASPETAQETPQSDAQAASEKKPAAKRNATKKRADPVTAESAYSTADLARAARARFGVPPEIVTAAMRVAGKDKATIAEAKDIVEKFMAREVK